jgi:adenylate cyclase
MSGRKAPDRIEQSPDRRKLVAVMYADMVGYSRLIGLDDAGTLQRLRALRTNLIDPAIEEHGGRIVQTGGDSLLIVFDSIDGAVRCAVEVQQQVPILDGEQPADRAIRFRVGINLGDAIADGSDLHGDAVNVAARLQAECPPGGICVSRSVRDHVHGRLDLAFEDLGVLNLRNIARPVEAFLLRPNATPSVSRSVERALVHDTGEALPLSDRPSIAVLAFTNMSGDPEQEYFSDGIADDIITELSRSRSLFVIARNSSFSYKGRAVAIKQIARELGVRYVLEGSVRRSGTRLRVTAQLIDAETGNHIWAERYDRPIEDVFSVQDEITTSVVRAIVPVVADAELQRALQKPPQSLDAWEIYQRGMWHMSKATASDNEEAKTLFQRAGQLQAGFAAPFIGLALSYHFDVLTLGARTAIDSRHLQHEAARTAVACDPRDAEAHAALGMAFLAIGNLGASLGSAERGITLNQNSALSHAVRCGALIWSGRREEGRDACSMVLRLNPRSPMAAAALGTVAASFYLEGDYVRTLDIARRCLDDYPSQAAVRRWLVAALGRLERREEAAVALKEFLSCAPDVFIAHVSNRPAYVSLAFHDQMLDGLRKAGWQG